MSITFVYNSLFVTPLTVTTSLTSLNFQSVVESSSFQFHWNCRVSLSTSSFRLRKLSPLTPPLALTSTPPTFPWPLSLERSYPAYPQTHTNQAIVLLLSDWPFFFLRHFCYNIHCGEMKESELYAFSETYRMCVTVTTAAVITYIWKVKMRF